MLDGRVFFVAGYTSGGAPYGCFVDESEDWGDDLPADEWGLWSPTR